MSYGSDFRYLFEGSILTVVMAELFLQAHGFRVYAGSKIYDPMGGMGGSAHVSLYVVNEDYQDALEVLVFVGVMDGFYYMNAVSLLLGRDVHDLLPADQLASVQKLAARLRVEEAWQTVVFLALFATIGVTLGFAISGLGAVVVLALVLALLELIPLGKSDKLQADLRSHLRREALPPAEIVVQLARRKACEYAVFLRSFGVLHDWLSDPAMHHGLVVDPYESRIVEAMRYGACMPVVALTDPSIAEVPVVGACRFSVQTDTEWPGFIAEILQGAALIVMHVTEMSQGLERELEIIRDGRLLGRTIFVMGRRGEKATTAIHGFNTVEATNAGARVLSHAVFEEWGLSDFIDAVENIRKVYTAWQRVPESIEDHEQAVVLDRMSPEKFQDTLPDVAATCPACGHTWMVNWDVSFKDRQCPQCKERWRMGVSEANDPTIQTALADLKAEAAQQEQRPNPPLGFGLKVVCFIFCAPLGIIIALYQQSTYGKRRARQVWKWVGYGWLCYVALLTAWSLTYETLWQRAHDVGNPVIPAQQTDHDAQSSPQHLSIDAALDEAMAQFDRGGTYFKGKDYSQAAHMWQLAAHFGVLEAYNNLGYLTYYGMGMKKDLAEGLRLWYIAAENGFTESQIHIADAYTDGEYLKKYFIEAYAWIQVAKHFTSYVGDDNLEKVFKEDAEKLVASLSIQLSKAEIAQAKQKAASYILKIDANRKSMRYVLRYPPKN